MYQDSPSFKLRASVLSGAICCISGPVGTLKPKCDEYANFPYFASVAFKGHGQNWPEESKKWWDPLSQTICIGGSILNAREAALDGRSNSLEVHNVWPGPWWKCDD